jgi:hypothetical protein
MYTSDGHMSAQVVRPGQLAFSDGGGLSPLTSGTAADWETVGRNFIAYSGRYWVKDASTVVHEMRVCMIPRLVGARQERTVGWTERGELVLSVEGVEIGGEMCRVEVVWERMGDNYGAKPE